LIHVVSRRQFVPQFPCEQHVLGPGLRAATHAITALLQRTQFL